MSTVKTIIVTENVKQPKLNEEVTRFTTKDVSKTFKTMKLINAKRASKLESVLGQQIKGTNTPTYCVETGTISSGISHGKKHKNNSKEYKSKCYLIHRSCMTGNAVKSKKYPELNGLHFKYVSDISTVRFNKAIKQYEDQKMNNNTTKNVVVNDKTNNNNVVLKTSKNDTFSAIAKILEQNNKMIEILMNNIK